MIVNTEQIRMQMRLKTVYQLKITHPEKKLVQIYTTFHPIHQACIFACRYATLLRIDRITVTVSWDIPTKKKYPWIQSFLPNSIYASQR